MFKLNFRPALAAALLAAVSAAQAGKVWAPASVCNLSFRSAGAVHWFDGMAFNEGSNTVFLDCPITRPDQQGLRADVFYTDNNSGAALRCYGYLPPTTSQGPRVSASRFSCASSTGCSGNSDPGFSSNTVRVLQISGSWMGVTCEVPPGMSIKLLSVVTP